jgi:type I site-specific restriction-modification system R (restriction) subunit
LEIVGRERRIPHGILYINGLPVVVFEFKTAIHENTTIHKVYVQLASSIYPIPLKKDDKIVYILGIQNACILML